ncbi:MAG: tRNA (adenosine(37)-N6)-threonylcarbamoyltransferase complex dimerization subunit type 1 TsaB [Gammaproteobacteria bacterium]|nr:tRNA (adenosine(37)-N6)-threonylcarbamoyltransferase complex dimerization subunit type 1 TsaB [Gammaproteobacteria bacterium]
MKILAIDTSSNACSAVLLEGNQQNFSCIERFEVAPRQHTQLILPMIDSVLDEAGYDIKQIDALAFGRGPGAFTGVRVATGVVQAVAYGADLQVAPISSLAAIAQRYSQLHNKLLVANDARMDEIYFGAYEMNNGFMTLSGCEQVLKPELLSSSIDNDGDIMLDKSWTMVGNGWSVYNEPLQSVATYCKESQDSHDISNESSYPHARDIAYLALNEINNDALVSAEQVRPVYLRDNVAKKPKKNL